MNTNFPHFYPGWELVHAAAGNYYFERKGSASGQRAVSRLTIAEMDLPLIQCRLEYDDREFQAFIERSK